MNELRENPQNRKEKISTDTPSYRDARKHLTRQGKTVADGWAGAVMQKTLAIQKYLLRTDRPTDRHGKV